MNACPIEESRNAISEANSEELICNPTTVTNKTPIFCEKADLERHEKESPSDEEGSSAKSIVECAASLSKRNKTNENIAVGSSYSPSVETNLKLKTEIPTKSDKTIENNSMVAFESRNDLTTSTGTTEETTDRKLSSTTNCDHKTNLNIANATCIQAEKSSGKPNKTKLPPKLLSSDRMMTFPKQNPSCEYRVRCLRFRNFLGLPGKPL